MNLSDVLLHPSEYDGTTVAEPWRWKLGSELSVLHVTVLGNLFLVDGNGAVSLLDTWSGQLHGVSQSYDEYKNRVASDVTFFESWFLVELVESLTATKPTRSSGHVFSPYVSPALGGSLTTDNFSLAPLNAYVATSSAEARALSTGHNP